MGLRFVLIPIFAMAFGAAIASHGASQEFVPAQTEAPSGASLIGARCIFCHGPALMLGFSQRNLDAGGPKALDTFLSGHHAPDAEARAAIVKFLSHPMGDPN